MSYKQTLKNSVAIPAPVFPEPEIIPMDTIDSLIYGFSHPPRFRQRWYEEYKHIPDNVFKKVEMRLLMHGIRTEGVVVHGSVTGRMERDLYREKAAEIFDVPYDHVTDEQRKAAKAHFWMSMYK